MYIPNGSGPDIAHAARRSPSPAAPPAAADPLGAPRLAFWIDPALVLKVGLVLVLLFDLASIGGRVLEHSFGVGGEALDAYVQITNVNREDSVPTWFQSSCLLACSAMLWTAGSASRRAGIRRHFAWRLLSAAFLYLSVDEAVALHEGVNRPVREALNLDGALYFAWVVVAVPVVLLLGLMLIPWLRDLPRRTRLAFVLSGAVYLSGTVGMELIGSVLWRGVGRDSLAYTLVTTVEETLEMTGMLLFLAAVASYYRRHLQPVTAAAGAGPREALPSPV